MARAMGCGLLCTHKSMRKRKSTTLTAREEQILQHLALGLSAKEIAETLSISTYTVRVHVANIHKKYGVHKTSRAVVIYISQNPTLKVVS